MTELKAGQQVQICEVCEINHKDMTEKPCYYCDLCKAWICDDCRKNWNARAVAALKRQVGRIVN